MRAIRYERNKNEDVYFLFLFIFLETDEVILRIGKLLRYFIFTQEIESSANEF